MSGGLFDSILRAGRRAAKAAAKGVDSAIGGDPLAPKDGLAQRDAAGQGRYPAAPDAEAQRAADEREMIAGVRELRQTTVKEVMVPRVDSVFLSLETGRDEILEKVVASGHSRLPVYEGSVDSVVGVLYAKDLLRALVKGESFMVADLLRKPFFVPESKRIDALLKEFRRKRVHIAVVVDEYGGVSGLVCMEDIIEEIVGEIQDEFDEEREDVVRLGEDAWLCDARADLDDVNRETGLALPEDDFDSLGGYVFALFGKIPARYEKASSGDLDFTVQGMDGHRITSVKISRRKQAAEEEPPK